MNSKKLTLYILLSLGGIVGGFIAKIFGAGTFSGLSLVLSGCGSMTGIYVWYKMGQ